MKKHRQLTIFLFGFSLLIADRPAFSTETLLLYAAASTYNPISKIIQQFNDSQNEIKIKASFASSSTLAKQIQAGAPAHLFISANPNWMNFLEQQNLLTPGTRINLLQNKLVLISPTSKSIIVKMEKDYNFAGQLNGKLCLGDPGHVPAGIYAKQGLRFFNWWDNIKSRVVGTKDVRAALALVERGECSAGIVYATDAKSSQKVKIVAKFPRKSHDRIVYPIARLIDSPDSASLFLGIVKSPQSRTIFKQYGFTIDRR